LRQSHAEEETGETNVVPESDAGSAKPQEKYLHRNLAGFFKTAIGLTD
jgi:hypothetical protein